MTKSTLVIFGNIDFASDNSKATINEIKAAYVFLERKEDINEKAEEYMDFLEYKSYIIPQYFKGEIEWK